MSMKFSDDYIEEGKALGREEGKKEGREEGKGELISTLIKSGKTKAEVADMFKISVIEVERLLAAVKH